MKTMAETLAEFVCGLDLTSVPDLVVEKAKTCILHNLAVGMGGASEGEIATKLALDARGRSTVIFHGHKSDPMSAAFANSVLVHARGQEDIHYLSNAHLGPTVMTAVIALAEDLGASGTQLLTSMIAGYEASIAVGRSWASKSSGRGFRASSLYGVIGAAAGSAKLLQLDSDATASALALSASFASGINQTWLAGTSEWKYQVGHAARDGILAARLAADGATGAKDIFEGPAGFYAAFTGERPLSCASSLGWGEDWGILEVSCKPYPCCAANQAAVDAVIRLMTTRGLGAEDISAINVTVGPFVFGYPGVNCKGPFTSASAAAMSIQFCVAAAVSSGNLYSSSFDESNRSGHLEFVQKVHLTADGEICRNIWDCIIELELVGGEVIRADRCVNEVPFSYSFDEELALLRNARSDLGFGEEQLSRLANAIQQLDRGAGLEAVMAQTIVTRR